MLAQQLTDPGMLPKIVESGGVVAVLGVFLWRLYPFLIRLVERQIEFVDQAAAMLKEVKDSQLRSERLQEKSVEREARIATAIARLPCSNEHAHGHATFAPTPHPPPTSAGQFNPTDPSHEQRTPSPFGARPVSDRPADRA